MRRSHARDNSRSAASVLVDPRSSRRTVATGRLARVCGSGRRDGDADASQRQRSGQRHADHHSSLTHVASLVDEMFDAVGGIPVASCPTGLTGRPGDRATGRPPDD
jgi:hypothetical protein